MIPVRELLQALGNDADEVARYLLCHGIRGACGVGEDCPIANYLRANGIHDPAVDLSSVTYARGDELLVEELPSATEDFVMLFDDGQYPELAAAGITKRSWDNSR